MTSSRPSASVSRTAVCLLMALVALLPRPGLSQTQSFSDLGHALYASGYTGSVWVNSFDPHQDYLAHGVFYPDIPIGTAGYEARYGMSITGSGTVTVNNDGSLVGNGTAHNPSPFLSDGSISIDLLSDGNLVDSAKLTFRCAANSDCPWTTTFTTRNSGSHRWTVRVYRHVEGSRCGGELNPDLNGPCRAALVRAFNLPASYQFTSTDLIDTNYAARPGATTTALCSAILPICNNTQSQTPTSAFTYSPTQVYTNTPVTFRDASTGLPTGWSWQFQDGSPSASSAQSPPAVTFATTGRKTVTLSTSNSAGPGTTSTQTVVVLDPTPTGTLTASVSSPIQCQAVTFTANVTGAPPLTYTWSVLDANGFPVSGPADGGTTFVWASAAGNAPGAYTGKVTVRNSASPNGVSFTKQIVLSSLPALTDISGATPTTNAFTANTVQFTAPAFSGATQIVWDYGDGRTETFTDPTAGRSPSHAYTQVGNYNAKVTIGNCLNQTFTSQPVSVAVTQITSLTASFRADLFCNFGQCFATANTPVGFLDSSEGAQTWDYDWTHADTSPATCNFTDTGHAAPVTSHTYTATGNVYPCLRVRSASGGQDVTVHPLINVGTGSQQQGSIAVAGPATGQVNLPYTFTASATGCSAGTGDWSWNVGAGTVAGGAGNTIIVAWSTTGSKTVSATNSACGTASGSAKITIGDVVLPIQAQITFAPDPPVLGQPVSFDSSSSTNVPSGAGIGWDFGDGSQLVNGKIVSHTYGAAGNYIVTLAITPQGCLNISCITFGKKTVTVKDPNAPRFTVTPASPRATEVVTLDATSSPNLPAGALVGWDFGDGTGSGFGATVLHAFPAAGTYNVSVSIAPQGCNAVTCLSLASQTVTVGPAPAVSAEFSADVTCSGPLGSETCQAKTAKAVNLTAAEAGAASYTWSFGDGSTGSGRQVTHTWAAPNATGYVVSLTVIKGADSAVKTRKFVVSGPVPPKTKAVLLPLVSQSRGPLLASNDLYVHNPGTTPLNFTLEFRKRSNVEEPARKVPASLQPGATLFVSDVLRTVFNLENVAGFIRVVTNLDTVQPIITAYNSSGTAGKLFGQAIGGTALTSTGNAAQSGPASTSQQIIGLNDNTARQSSLGFSNPSDQAATYRLRFFDDAGRLLNESGDLTLAAYAQQQLSVQQIRDQFGLEALTDYRVEVQTVSGATVFPFGSDVRVATGDPSFAQPGSSRTSKVYLLGVTSGPQGKAAYRTDVLLSNVGTQTAQTTVTFTGAVSKASAPKPFQVTVAPGGTERLENVMSTPLGLKGAAAGMLTLTSTSPGGVFPIAEAETYDNTNPLKRFGQTVPALTDADAADATKRALLVGLRQDGSNKTTIWVFNPSAAAGEYDLVYHGLDGAVLGTLKSVKLGAGQVRQIASTQHPVKAVPSGFTVEVVVKSGKALAAAQVVSTGSGDPAYIKGEVR